MTTLINFIAAVLTGLLLVGGLTVLLGSILQGTAEGDTNRRH